jgi:hypothetical protein
MITSALQLRPGRVEPEFGRRGAPRTVKHTTIADGAGCVETEAYQNYAIGEAGGPATNIACRHALRF